jgi:tetratricopeptide (TPR) repeat protein
MRFRKTLASLTLATALVFAQPAWAQQKSVAPSGAGPRPNAVRPYIACAAATPALPPRAQQKPFTQEQVSNMVRDGFGDESGAKLIEQRGIDFAPAEDFIQTLKAAGASEAFLNALRAAVTPGLSPAHAALKGGSTTAGPPASAKKPINQVQVFALLVGQVPSHRVTMLVQERGIDFEPTDDYLQEVRLAGGEDELISALKSAKVTKPVTVDPAAQARQAEVRQHVARGAALAKKGQYAEAEQEYRAALLFDPHNPDLYDSLAYVLGQQKKWDDGEAAVREALSLNPNDEFALGVLGLRLEYKGDWDGAIAEFREALRLSPNDDMAHVELGFALEQKADWDGEIAEEREALRLNPNNDMAHCDIGAALGNKGDWDGEIVEERTALRLEPNNALAHFYLGNALEKKGDMRGALEEFRAAYTLDPKNANYKQNYERLLPQQNK